MSNARTFTGGLCVAPGLAVIGLPGYGVVDPIGMADSSSAASMTAALLDLPPGVALALAVFAPGLWLLKGRNTQ